MGGVKSCSWGAGGSAPGMERRKASWKAWGDLASPLRHAARRALRSPSSLRSTFGALEPSGPGSVMVRQ